MADAGKYALCAFARNRSAEARQVALVPAQEELDAYGEQVPLLQSLFVSSLWAFQQKACFYSLYCI